MSRSIGVNCDTRAIYLAVAADDELVRDAPEKIDVPKGLEENSRLLTLGDEVGSVIEQVGADRVVVLAPESNYKATHKGFTRRIALETVVRIAAAQRDVGAEILSRRTLRSRLGLPMDGSLSEHISTVFPEPVGKYWGEGRGLAALAAVARERVA